MVTKTGHFIFQGHGLKNTTMFALHFDLEVDCNIFLPVTLIVKYKLSNKLYFWHLKNPCAYNSSSVLFNGWF